MTAAIIDGKRIAEQVLAEVEAKVAARVAAGRPAPHLAAILAGDDPASEHYVRSKRRTAERLGMVSSLHRLPGSATTADVLEVIARLNRDPEVSGILPQLPMPPGVDTATVIEAVDPARDVDGLHPCNAGRLASGIPTLVPCTPAGVIELLDRTGIQIDGARAVVVGRSNIVGKPVAQMLLARNATVTICHSRTLDLGAICRSADILVAAVGRPHMVTPAMVKPGATVVDVGINRVDGKLRGDVAPEVAQVAAHLTPVPGGVGPMTIAMLMRNTLFAEERRRP